MHIRTASLADAAALAAVEAACFPPAEAATAAERRGQVGSGDRSEKIRTYRFFQGQVVEQRLTGEERYFNLKDILDGDLDPLIDALVTADRAEKLKNGGEES